MDKSETVKLGTSIIKLITNNNLVPADLFKILSSNIPGDSKTHYKIFIDLWKKLNNGPYSLDINQPLIISRGFNNTTTEEQLSTFLPEEKILINKDIFRNHLEGVDLINIDAKKQNSLIELLNKESIGLSNNDVLLYYNLLKINQLSMNLNNSDNTTENNRDFSLEILTLVKSAFNLTPENIKRVNSGKSIDDNFIIELLNKAIKNKRINPHVLAICLGDKNSKFINFFIDYISYLAKQRGDEVQDYLTYMGLYIMINGSSQSDLQKLNLGSNLEAFLTDRIGRVKSIYYVALLFLHAYNVLLVSQIFEISNKYFSSPNDMKIKLEKLYKAETRRTLLCNNSLTIASRKISSYKNESLEVLNAFKRFSGNKKEFITVADIFNIDYR